MRSAATAAIAWFAVLGAGAYAQTFEPIAALSFVKPFAGSDPIPQMITVANVGTAFRFNVAVSTSGGGNWLSATPTGTNCCLAPQTIAVIITTSPTMAINSYSGQVTLSSGSVTMQVPVTLTVVAPAGPYFDNGPGQLSFAMAPGGSIASQVMQIRSAGTAGGTLNWSLTSSTYNSANWLTVSATSGTTPQYITVGIQPQNLPGGGLTAGDYVGQLLFQTASGPSITVPICVTVGSPIIEQVNPLYFTQPYTGANPLPQVLTIASTSPDFRFNVAAYSAPLGPSGASWLSVSPSGTNCCATPDGLTVSAAPAVTLAAGTYTGEIWISSGNLSAVIPVVMTVAPLAGTYFGNLAGGLSFSLPAAPATAPPGQPLLITGAGGSFPWTLTTTTGDNGNWLAVSSTSGGTPGQLTVSIVPANLPGQGLVAGTFVGNLLFQQANSAVTVPISVFVGNAFKQTNGLNFTMLQAGPDPLPQVLAISSTGTDFRFTVTSFTATGGSWLAVSPTGVNCCATPIGLTVSITAPVTMAAGTYTGEVVVNNGEQTLAIPVTLTIVPAGSVYLDNLPGGLSFSMSTGGQPPPQQFQIRGLGSSSLNWSLSMNTADGGAWLAATPTSGVAPPTTQVTVSIVPANLPGAGLVAGTFNGQLLVQAASGSYTIPISLIVGGNAFGQVNGVNFTMQQAGPNPLPQTVQSTSIGTDFRFTVSSSTATGGSWLSVSPTGVNCCATPDPITISVNAPATMAAGTYTGEVVMNNGTNVQTIPVTLTVAPATGPSFDNLPGQLAYSLVTRAGNPPPQSLLIQNRGTGTLNWTATVATADSGNWLTVSSPSGTAPSQVTVSVVTAQLPGAGLIAGNFIGQVLLLAGGSSVTVPVSVAVGGDDFAQTNGIEFTMPAGGANPLPQTLSLTSIGAAFRFTVSSATGNGGSWLTVSPTGVNCCATSQVLTATVSAPTGLAAGTYTGQIVANNGTTSATIPVILNVVAPAINPLFDNVPGQMSFSAATAATPASQTVQIRNYGGGQLNWTVTPVTADSGNWLTVSSPSGVAPATVTVAINAANLPSQGLVAGLYTGELWFQSGIPGSSVTIPVSVNIGPNIFAQPAPLIFSAAFGSNPLTQTVTVNSTGTDFRYTSTYAAGNGGAWLSTTPTGINCCATPGSLTVKVTNPTTPVPPGTYTGQVVMNEGGFAMTVPVTLTVTGNFTFSLSAYTANAGANGGTGSVGVVASAQNAPWTASSNVSWITITSGTSGTGNGTVNYNVAPTTLTASRQGTLTIAGQTFTVTQAGAAFTVSPLSATAPSTASTGSVTVTSTSTAAQWTAVSNNSFITITSGGNGTGNGTVMYAVAANTTGSAQVGTMTIAGQTVTITQAAGTGPQGLGFFAVTPCRVVDTRTGQGKTGQFGPPTMTGGSTRSFQVPQANCNIPSTAQAFSLNVTVVPPAPLLYLSIWPTGQSQPVVSTLNANNGAIVANAAIVPAGTGGAISVFVSDTTDVIIDVNGYFAPPTSSALAFYPVTPCRVADTRAGQGFTGAFGPPGFTPGSSRNFPIPSSSCGIPSTAQAYALNMTVVPPGPLLYLTTWPTGVVQPTVSTLNAEDGRIAANAAIVPAGTGGDISVFTSDATDVIIDINGYFAPPGSPGALLFYPATPCRIADTRSGSLPFGAPALTANSTRSFPIQSSSCGLPSTALAYSLNMTVVPPASLLYLTTWPVGVPQPVVSTLNAPNGQITANAALVPAGTGGAIDVFVSDATNLIIDVNGYFAH